MDGAGAVVNRYQYDAFGNTVGAVEKVQNRFRYAGEQYDQVTGQYYLRARFYNPVVGRFTQEDTFRGDGLNLYSYVQNNPISYHDPSGYSCEKKAYIFYALSDSNNGGFDERAKADAARWKKEMGTEAVLIPVKSEEEFKKRWAEMDDKNGPVQYVGLYFHSNSMNQFINTDNNEYITAFDTGKVRGTEGADALYIGDLEKKKINNLYLYSCNSGHLDHKENNLASTYLKNQDVGNVYGWDGSMKWSDDGQYTRLAKNQHYFQSHLTNGDRLPEGLVKYTKDPKTGEIVTSVVKEDKWSGPELYTINDKSFLGVPIPDGVAKFKLFKTQY